MEDAQQVNCHSCTIDLWRVRERIWDPLSGKYLQPKLPLEDLFDYRPRLIEVLRNNSCNRKRKLLKEIGESFPKT
jgi:hypothetical protein